MRPRLGSLTGAFLAAAVAVLAGGSAASAEPRDKESFEIRGETTCTDGSGRWEVEWLIDNKTSKQAKILEAKVATEGRDSSAEAGSGKPELTSFTDSFAPARGNGNIADQLVVGADQDAAQISVTLRWDEPEGTFDISRLSQYIERPKPCVANPAVPVPSGRPVGLVPQTRSTCTELLVAITTPIDSAITAAELRSSVTRARDVLQLVAGRESVRRYPARPGLAVDVTLIGGAGWSQTVTWQPPRSCTASATRSSSPTLFRTGMTTVAAVLIAAAIVLAMLATRRRRGPPARG